MLLAGFGLAIVALLTPTWNQPPVWDTTTGLFPAAQFLAENGFDLPRLLVEPGWHAGGPNVHPLSWPTWVTALALWVSGEGGTPFLALHALQYALGAGVLLGVFRLAAPAIGMGAALGVCGVVLLFPLYQVQQGYLYTELPLAFATIWAVHAHVGGRDGRALAFAALACLTKEAGVTVPVALAAATLLEASPGRWRRAALLLSVPVLWIGLQLAVVPEREAGLGSPGYFAQLADAGSKLSAVPDWALLLGLYLAVAVLRTPRWWRALARPDEALPGERACAVGALVVGAFLGFYASVPLVIVEEYLLPRYYVQIVPLVFAGLAVSLGRRASPRVRAGVLVTLAVLFLANREGAFYPDVAGNEFSLAERSFEYRDLLAAQQRLVAAAAALPDALPVYYGLPEHYLFRYPRSGYASGPPDAGVCLWLDPQGRRARLGDFPDHFVLLQNFLGYGGRQVRALLRQARTDPGWRVRATRFDGGRYATTLFELSRATEGTPRRVN